MQKRQTLPSRPAGKHPPATVFDSSVLRAALYSHPQPLANVTRAHLEPLLGHDFSRVRIHTDGIAAQASRELGARAFTVRSDIVFGKDQYDPNSGSGSRLLAHELVHVVQQRGGGAVQRQPAEHPASKPETKKDDEQDEKQDAGASVIGALSVAPLFPGVFSVSEDMATDAIEEPSISAARDPAVVSSSALSIVPPDHPSEREADTISEAIASGVSAPPSITIQSHASCGLIQRQVYWDERTDGKLTWADYTAKAPAKDPKVAESQWDSISKVGIPQMMPTASVKGTADPPGKPAECEAGGKKAVQYKATAGYDLDSFKVRAVMYPDQSWVRDTTKTGSLLAHEQGHFDIAHVMAEKIKPCILTLGRASAATVVQCGAQEEGDAATKAFQKQDQGDSMLSVWGKGTALMLKIQNDYDDETDHSRKRAKQTQWLKAIADTLPKYPLACPSITPAPKNP